MPFMYRQWKTTYCHLLWWEKQGSRCTARPRSRWRSQQQRITRYVSLRRDSESLYHCGECSHIFPYPSRLPYKIMDIFFATKTAGKSTRKNTCCQRFVTDKCFVYVVPLKSKSNVLDAVKQFAEEIGAPDALIFDMSGEQTSQLMRTFCHEIGTSLRIDEQKY